MVCICCVCDIVHVLVLAITHELVPYHFYNFYADADLSWKLYADRKEVRATCSILTSYPQVISSPSEVAHMLQDVSQAVVCPGNPDEEFISLCKTRGSIMKGNRGSTETVAFIDSNDLRIWHLYRCA